MQIIRGDIASLDNQIADLREESRERFTAIDQRLDDFITQQQSANARIIELLGELSTTRPPE